MSSPQFEQFESKTPDGDGDESVVFVDKTSGQVCCLTLEDIDGPAVVTREGSRSYYYKPEAFLAYYLNRFRGAAHSKNLGDIPDAVSLTTLLDPEDVFTVAMACAERDIEGAHEVLEAVTQHAKTPTPPGEFSETVYPDDYDDTHDDENAHENLKQELLLDLSAHLMIPLDAVRQLCPECVDILVRNVVVRPPRDVGNFSGVNIGGYNFPQGHSTTESWDELPEYETPEYETPEHEPHVDEPPEDNERPDIKAWYDK